MKTGKIKVGTKVRVARTSDVDANAVAGRIGTVVESFDRGSILVRFSRWVKGHGEGKHNWYVSSAYLTRVKVS
jgi:hypothetical protein